MRSWTLFFALLTAVFATISSTTADRTAAQSIGFTGAIPPPNSIAFLATIDPISPAQLTSHLNAAGCNVAVLAIHPSTQWQVYIASAPDPINAGFPALLDAQLPFFVRCGESASALKEAATWVGSDSQTLDTFSVPQGDWEYCAELVATDDIHTGVRVSLYNDNGIWLSSDSGVGGTGSLGCTAIIPQPELLELRVFAPYASWSVTVRPRSDEPLSPQLAYWSSAPTAIAPNQITVDGVLFSSEKSEVTSLFTVNDTQLSYCLTLVDSSTDLITATPNMAVSILFEDEPGQVSEYTFPSESLAVGDQTCVDTEVRQPGRYRLFIKDSLPLVGWEVLVAGAT